MRSLLLSLLFSSMAHGAVFAPVSRDYTWEISLFDGSAMVTGATVTVSVGKDTDADGVDDAWWNGSTWTTYNAVNMTERTGNISLEGKYGYTLSTTAIGATPGAFNFSSKYTGGGTTIYNRETVYTTMPNTASSGSVTVSEITATGVADIWDELKSGHTTSGSFGAYLDVAVSTISAVASRCGAANIIIQSPVATDGTITIIKGDSYTGASALTLSRTYTGVDLTGGTIVANVMTRAEYMSGTGTATLSNVACTFTGGTSGSTLTVTFPLTAVQTAALDVSQYTYQIKATSTGSTIHTPFMGTLTVRRAVP